jgi:hypothetical protein
MGIEPTSSAWEAEVMPLYDTRLIRKFYPKSGGESLDCDEISESDVKLH